MGRKKRRETLFAFMNGLPVGELLQARSGRLQFTYDEEWMSSRFARPISVSLPLSTRAYSGDVVYNFFDNLLPDNLNIRDRIQGRFGAKTNRCFDLLYHIGRDCVGAIQLSPYEKTENVKKVTARPLTPHKIGELLQNYRTAPLGMLDDDEDFRISLAGAQEKAAFLWWRGRWHLPARATPTSHIFKLPIGRIEHSGIDLSESVENEWLCHKILAEFQVPVAPCEIATFEGQKALVVERFDRRWTRDRSWLIRLPQEDLCQALKVSPGLKYESDGGPGMVRIMKLLLGSQQARDDRRTFMRVQFLFWLLGAIDGHAKNFSLFLDLGGRYRLTPIYDVLSAYPVIDSKKLHLKKIKMAMAVEGKNRHYHWHQIKRRHWLNTAKLCRFSGQEMNTIIDQALDEMSSVIARVEKTLPKKFPDKIAHTIFRGMRQAQGYVG